MFFGAAATRQKNRSRRRSSSSTLAKWNAWINSLLAAGRLAGAHALEHPATGKTLLGRDRIVSDGPYAESKDLVSGAMIVEAESLAEATELGARLSDFRARSAPSRCGRWSFYRLSRDHGGRERRGAGR